MTMRRGPLLHLVSFLVLTRPCASYWPQFLGPIRNGGYPGTEPLAESWPKEGPPVVWRKKIGQGFSGPAVSGGSLVLFHRIGDKEAVECLDAGTGKLLWSFDYPTGYRDDFGFDEGPRATPTIAKGKVFTFGAEGLLHCLDFQTGKKIWNINTKAEFGASKGFFDLVFLSASYQTGAALLRVKENSVEKIWGADDVLSNHYATSVHSDGFLFGFDGRQEHGENLRCVEFKTGKIRWSEDRFGAGTVTMAGKHLLVLTENGELLLAAASPDGFKPVARAQLLPKGVRAYPALADGRLYARSKDTLLCVDLRPAK